MNIIAKNRKTVYSIVRNFLNEYRAIFTKKTFEVFFWVIISIITFHHIQSVKFIWEHLICRHIDSHLNSLYYFFSYSQWKLSSLMRKTTKIVLSLIPESLEDIEIYLLIDDTLQEKFGDSFAGCQSFFDHVRRNNSSYLKGNSFVCLAISIPVFSLKGKVVYITLPIDFRLYNKEKSKLAMASEMIDNIMELLEDKKVILLCDSWYTKGDVIDCVEEYENLFLIGAVRCDTAIFDLPPPHDGKRGRPRKYGEKLNIRELEYEEVDDYHQACKVVMTRLFDNPVEISVTVKEIDEFKSPKMYINTDLESKSLSYISKKTSKDKFTCARTDSEATKDCNKDTLPKYARRWDIEVIFYQLKTFWSFGNYMVTTQQGIETYVNLLAVAYSLVSIFPHWAEGFGKLKSKSPQYIKNLLAHYLREELILGSFVSGFESQKIYLKLRDCFHSFISLRKAA